MKLIWAKEKTHCKNITLAFCYFRAKKGDCIRLAAGDFYRVFVNGNFLSYGPSRTAAGYSRVRDIDIKEDGVIVVETAGYYTACYGNDKFIPFFGAELFREGCLVANSDDFLCVHLNDRVQKTERYSYQRNYVEVYTEKEDRESLYRGKNSYPVMQTAEISETIVLLDSGEDTASYEQLNFSLKNEEFSDLSELKPKKLWWTDYVKEGKAEGYLPEEYEFDFGKWIKEKRAMKKTYALTAARTGFIQAEFTAEKDGFALLVFDEYAFSETKPDICFQRTNCNDYIVIRLKSGVRRFISFEPYELKYLCVYFSDAVNVSVPSLIALENNEVSAKFFCSDPDIYAIYQAAVNTFKQNALDIFMDCPGRERAGWLCDSYFTAQAEALLCGKSNIEERFLENFLVGNCPEIPQKMLPMCFPSELFEGVFIPNWAMWFIVELRCFANRSNRVDLIARLKKKVYDLFEYFERFENEYGLLENLEGWIFVEWSVANEPSHVCGVNIPGNMMYAKALDCAASLYNDVLLAKKAENIRKTIVKSGFDGKVFRDNLVRVNGSLVLTDNYSETCQYYALFCEIPHKKVFEDFLLKKYGTKEAARLPEASNMLTGHCLRMIWLLQKGYREQCIKEAKILFLKMAKSTGTLWENDQPSASCNHGFTSVLTVFLVDALFGYKGYDVNTKQLFFSKNYCKNVDCKVVLAVGNKLLEISVKAGKRQIVNGTHFKIITI